MYARVRQVRVCVRECACVRVRERVRVRAHACVRVRAPACARGCACVRVRVCVSVCDLGYKLYFFVSLAIAAKHDSSI